MSWKLIGVTVLIVVVTIAIVSRVQVLKSYILPTLP